MPILARDLIIGVGFHLLLTTLSFGGAVILDSITGMLSLKLKMVGSHQFLSLKKRLFPIAFTATQIPIYS